MFFFLLFFFLEDRRTVCYENILYRRKHTITRREQIHGGVFTPRKHSCATRISLSCGVMNFACVTNSTPLFTLPPLLNLSLLFFFLFIPLLPLSLLLYHRTFISLLSSRCYLSLLEYVVTRVQALYNLYSYSGGAGIS